MVVILDCCMMHFRVVLLGWRSDHLRIVQPIPVVLAWVCLRLLLQQPDILRNLLALFVDDQNEDDHESHDDTDE